jgi:hypothetical protein
VLKQSSPTTPDQPPLLGGGTGECKSTAKTQKQCAHSEHPKQQNNKTTKQQNNKTNRMGTKCPYTNFDFAFDLAFDFKLPSSATE